MNDSTETLLAIIQDVAKDDYSNEVMAPTGAEVPEPVRTIAEAIGILRKQASEKA